MEGDLDLDIICHLGFIKNIDVMKKGIYYIQATLYYGNDEQKIIPKNAFSAACRFESYVDQQVIPASQIISVCEVDDVLHTFRTRSFVIRYKHEKYELNEGVSWKITIPSVKITNNSLQLNPLSSQAPLLLKFDLFFAPLLETGTMTDLMHKVDEMIPDFPKFEKVASQDLFIPTVTAGFHEYFPVTFDSKYFFNVDCMVHCAVTAIRYDFDLYNFHLNHSNQPQQVSSPPENTKNPMLSINGNQETSVDPTVGSDTSEGLNGKNSVGSQNGSGENNSVGSENGGFDVNNPVGSEEFNRKAESDSILANKLSRPVLRPYSTRILQTEWQEEEFHNERVLRILFPVENTQNPINSTDEPKSPSLEQWKDFLDIHLAPIRRVLDVGNRKLLRLCEDWAESDIDLIGDKQRYNDSVDEKQNYTLDDLAQVLCKLWKEKATEQILAVLAVAVDEVNLLLASQSGKLLSLLKRIMYPILNMLQNNFIPKIHMYWKKQVLVYTCSYAGTENLIQFREDLLMDIIAEKIRADAATDPARGLLLYDPAAFEDPRKLPYLVIEQYIGEAPSEFFLSNTEGEGTLVTVPADSPSLNSALQAVAKTYSGSMEGLTADSLSMCFLPPGGIHLARGGRLLGGHPLAVESMDLEDLIDLSALPLLKPLVLYSPDVLGDGINGRMSRRGSRRPSVESNKKTEKTLKTISFNVDGDKIERVETIEKVAVVEKIEKKEIIDKIEKVDKIESNLLQRGNLNKARSTLMSFDDDYDDDDDDENKSEKKIMKLGDLKKKGKLPKSMYENEDKLHLIILHHGYQGTSYDMKLIQNAITTELPSYFHVFNPSCNEDRTIKESIAQMGKRLAFELLKYCRDHFPFFLEKSSHAKISFICHSMGGLIVRSALSERTMAPFRGKLHVYCSLASPHLGTLCSDSPLVSTGLWAMSRYYQSKSLKELVLADGISGKVKKTLLYKLSENGVLDSFAKVVLVSSPKDQYVPNHSARIQISSRVENDSSNGSIVREMASNILSTLKSSQLIRISIENNIMTQDVNAMIGRSAHICYLENQIPATQVVLAIAPFLLL